MLVQPTVSSEKLDITVKSEVLENILLTKKFIFLYEESCLTKVFWFHLSSILKIVCFAKAKKILVNAAAVA